MAMRAHSGSGPTLLMRLRVDHANFGRVLRCLDDEVIRLEQLGTPPADLLLIRDIVDYLIDYADQWHHPCEDVIYEQLRNEGAGDEMEQILAQHRDLTSLGLETFRFLTGVIEGRIVPTEMVVEHVRRFSTTQRQHLDFENAFVFPFAEDVLSDEQWLHLEQSAPLPDDPVFGTAADQQSKLYRCIMDSRAPA